MFEWGNKGVKPQIENLQKIKHENMLCLETMFTDNAYICLKDIMDLPQDIIVILKPQQIKFLLIYPLVIEDEIKGFITIDECRYERKWKSEELEILNIISRLISRLISYEYG